MDGCSLDSKNLTMEILTKTENNLRVVSKELKDEMIEIKRKLRKTRNKKFEKELEKKYNEEELLNIEKSCLKKFKNEYSRKLMSGRREKTLKYLSDKQHQMKNEHCDKLKREMKKMNDIVKKDDDKRIGNYYIDKNAKLWTQFDMLNNNYDKKPIDPYNKIVPTTKNFSSIQNDTLITNDISKHLKPNSLPKGNKFDLDIIKEPNFCQSCYDTNKKDIMSKVTINDFDIREHRDFKNYDLKRFNC